MKIIGLIPARGGSKRVERKNIADLGGRPLIAWTIEAARTSEALSDVWLSSEDQQICCIGHEYGANPIVRPASLANDRTPSIDVVRDAFDRLANVDAIMLLQPTSPFRTAADINAAADMLGTGDAVVSVTDAPDDLVFELGHANRLRPFQRLVQCNGAIYLLTRSAFERGLDWYSGISYAYRMPKERSLDIDTPMDLDIARMIISKSLTVTTDSDQRKRRLL